MFSVIITVIGLIVLEVVQSVDNAIVNAHMLKTMSRKARRWFLVWGIFFAVLVVRGVLPLLIVRLSTPDITVWGAILAMVGSDPAVAAAMDESKYVLLIGGGMFLLLLYFHWLFLEKKEPYFIPDKLIKPHLGVWFFAVAALLLTGLLWLEQARPLAMIAVATGNAAFFILYGFRQMAEQTEGEVEKRGHSDLAKLLFLEILDLSFSIDGVFGAFAFTTNVILIIVGNGIGAFIVRDLTIRGVEKVARYRWLKNGAMTSIGLLGIFMMADAMNARLPDWLPTLTTITVVGVAFYASHQDLKKLL